MLLGTGGAIKKAIPLLGSEFFVMYGDSYLDIEFAPVYEAFVHAAKPALMTVFHNRNQWDTSNVEFADGEIRRHDKANRTPDMQYIDYGLGLFRATVFERWAEGTYFDLADVFATLLRGGKLAGYEAPRRFYEIGTTEGLAETAEMLRNRT
jgi:NDP-sugar pyrophosphorylase family protein